MRSKAAVVLLVVLALLGGAGLLESEAQQPVVPPTTLTKPIKLVADPISTPTKAAEKFEVKLHGPATPVQGGFIVTVEAPKGAELRWRDEFFRPGEHDPAPMPMATELFDRNGKLARIYLPAPPGKYRLRLEAQLPKPGLDPWAYAELVVAVDGNLPEPKPKPEPPGPTPPGPEPEPKPTPTVPDDEFGNVGQTVFSVVSALSDKAKAQAKITADLYRNAADALEDGTFVSINEAAKWLQVERKKLWPGTTGEWSAMEDAANDAWNAKWPMDKSKVARFYNAVAAGLGAVQ